MGFADLAKMVFPQEKRDDSKKKDISKFVMVSGRQRNSSRQSNFNNSISLNSVRNSVHQRTNSDIKSIKVMSPRHEKRSQRSGTGLSSVKMSRKQQDIMSKIQKIKSMKKDQTTRLVNTTGSPKGNLTKLIKNQ